jgi:hypothetical protein
MRLSPMRVRSLKKRYGWQMVSALPRSVKLWLAQTDTEIEKLKTTDPGWVRRRIAMLREFRIHRPRLPLPRVPNGYRSVKI